MAQVRTEADLVHFPFGLMLWASAAGLAERLAAEPERVRGERVLELGAGAGLVGLVARHLGAEVVQTDYHADALALCRENAALNGVEGVDILPGDWRMWPEGLRGFACVVAADILYDRMLHPALQCLLPRLLAPGGQIILADPLRPQALVFLDRVERQGWRVRMEGHRVRWAGDPREIALFFLEPPVPS